MDRGIWAIWYGLAGAHQAEYLDWFHRVHVADKLSRPGHLWAAHYELVPGEPGRHEPGKGYLALFGGGSAHVFLNPSPGQLLLRQSAETRRMIAPREQPLFRILAEEVRVDGSDVARRGPGMTPGAVIQMGKYNAASPVLEDDLGSWYAQQRLPLLGALPGLHRRAQDARHGWRIQARHTA